MVANERTDYLRLALQEQDAARRSTSVEARERHEALAIVYEMHCLAGAELTLNVKQIEPAL